MRDKQLDAVLPLLHGMAGRILTTAPHWHRSRDPRELAAALGACGSAEVECIPRVVDALERARALAAGRVLVTGSNFLVAEALDRLGVDELLAPAAAPLWDEGKPLRRREGET
jgi:folylpolyglutamate synthase/dihydropteroate synthase